MKQAREVENQSLVVFQREIFVLPLFVKSSIIMEINFKNKIIVVTGAGQGEMR